MISRHGVIQVWAIVARLDVDAGIQSLIAAFLVPVRFVVQIPRCLVDAASPRPGSRHAETLRRLRTGGLPRGGFAIRLGLQADRTCATFARLRLDRLATQAEQAAVRIRHGAVQVVARWMERCGLRGHCSREPTTIEWPERYHRAIDIAEAPEELPTGRGDSRAIHS